MHPILYILFLSIFGLTGYKINNSFQKNVISGSLTKENIHSYTFDIISAMFICIFIYFTYARGVKYGFQAMVFIWALLVCAVPFPQAGLLLTFPIKHFSGISMDISQLVISLFGMLILLYFYLTQIRFLQKNMFGTFFLNIVKKRAYHIFAISIFATVIASYLIDELIDQFIIKKYKTPKNQNNRQDKTNYQDVSEMGKFISRIDIYVGLLVFTLLNFIYFTSAYRISSY